jgi:hypothetical protein
MANPQPETETSDVHGENPASRGNLRGSRRRRRGIHESPSRIHRKSPRVIHRSVDGGGAGRSMSGTRLRREGRGMAERGSSILRRRGGCLRSGGPPVAPGRAAGGQCLPGRRRPRPLGHRPRLRPHRLRPDHPGRRLPRVRQRRLARLRLLPRLRRPGLLLGHAQAELGSPRRAPACAKPSSGHPTPVSAPSTPASTATSSPTHPAGSGSSPSQAAGASVSSSPRPRPARSWPRPAAAVGPASSPARQPPCRRWAVRCSSGSAVRATGPDAPTPLLENPHRRARTGLGPGAGTSPPPAPTPSRAR